MRRLWGTWLLVAASAGPGLVRAQSGECRIDAPRLTEEIPRQSLDQALSLFRQQTGLPLVNEVPDQTSGRRSRRVRAATAPLDALRTMLRGSGLQFRCVDSRVVVIQAVPVPPPPAALAEASSELLVSQEEVLAEVLVTSSRNQPDRRGNTPYTTDDIIGSGIKGIDEIGRLTPGVDFDFFTSVSSGIYTNLAIRGVTDRHGNTAGVWFDDVPLPAATSNTFARGFPYAFDMDRIEVLRGPQPALLGANAQGGAVQYMPTQPAVRGKRGRLRAEWAVTDGGDPVRELGAAYGAPIKSGVLGFRVSGWYRSEGGWVDRVDPFTRAVVDRNANAVISKSARLALRLDPMPGLTLMPSLLYQSAAGRDSSSFMIYESPDFPGDPLSDPAAGEFHNGSLIGQPYDDTLQLALLKGQLRLGKLRLDSVSGYFHRVGRMISDDTESMRWGGFGNPRGPAYPVSMDDLITTNVRLEQRSYSHQLQISSQDGTRLSWLVGVYFSNLDSVEDDHVYAQNAPPIVRALGLNTFDLAVPTAINQRQLAGFGQARLQLGKHLALTAGLRVERQEVTADSEAPLQYHAYRTDTVLAPQYGISYDAGNPARGVSREYYLAAAVGYAPGNVDAARPTCGERPAVYPTDTLWNYEAGTRQSWKDGRLRLELNVFRIRWDNGDEARRTCLFMHMPGKAASDGLGLTTQAALGKGFALHLAASYVDARYTQTLYNDGTITVHDIYGPVAPDGGLIVSAGDALGTPPQVTSPWSVTASISKQLRLGSGSNLQLRVEDVYHSRNRGPFYTGNPAARYPGNLTANPASHLFNFRAGLDLGRLDVALFVNNLFDARPVMMKRNKGNDVNTLFYATTYRPRTIGLSVDWRFAGR